MEWYGLPRSCTAKVKELSQSLVFQLEKEKKFEKQKKEIFKKKKRNVKINKDNQKETKRNKENQKSEAHEKAKTVAAQSLALIVNSPLLSWLAAPLHSTTLHSHSLFHSLSQLWLKINT